MFIYIKIDCVLSCFMSDLSQRNVFAYTQKISSPWEIARVFVYAS